MFQVYKTPCKNCLLSPDSIVSPQRRKQILNGCKMKQTSFDCHTSTIEGSKICCKRFFDEFGHFSQMIRIAERLNMIEFVDQPEKPKLPTWNEMHNKAKNGRK